MDRRTDEACRAMVIEMPSTWVAARYVAFPNPYDDRSPSDPLDLSPHVSCEVCWRSRVDRVNRLIEEHEVYVSPQEPPLVPLKLVTRAVDDVEVPLFLGTCPECGTVYWAPDVTPTDEELQLDAQRLLLLEQESARRIESTKRTEQAERATCERRGHDWRGPLERTEGPRRKARAVRFFRCERCGAERPVLPGDRKR